MSNGEKYNYFLRSKLGDEGGMRFELTVARTMSNNEIFEIDCKLLSEGEFSWLK